MEKTHLRFLMIVCLWGALSGAADRLPMKLAAKPCATIQSIDISDNKS